ncbi:MAG: FAD-dependent monooxygenase [Proteobacteria bacterium]|nr:FAD-dependent monooxygenase [Pseudomonadota bacterium]
MSSHDVVIVGAGVAGAALAARLGRAGRRVLLLERDLRAPDLFVGELLQPGGARSLEALGLLGCVQGIDAQRTRGFAVIHGEEQRALAYPTGSDGQRGAPVEGYAFHHGRFVMRLREAAAAAPGVELRCGTASELIRAGTAADARVTGVVYRDREGHEQRLQAQLVVAADGRSSRLRRCVGAEAPARLSHSVGVLLRGGVLPHAQHGHVFVTQPAPILGYQIGSDEVRLLVDLPGELPRGRGDGLVQFLRTTTAPQLPEPLRAALLATLEAGELPRVMPTYALAPRPVRLPGLVLLGDALNMRHPVTGGGMTVALNDVCLLAEGLATVALGDSVATERTLTRFYEARRPLALTIDGLAGALYEVLRADEPGLERMRAAMMQYWQFGGFAATGPMSLLSGLSPRPALLLLHYTAVALLGVGGSLVPVPGVHVGGAPDVRGAAQLARAAYKTLEPQLRRAFAH